MTAHPFVSPAPFITRVLCLVCGLCLAGCHLWSGQPQGDGIEALPAGRAALQTWAVSPFEALGPLPAYVIQAALSDGGEVLAGRVSVTVPNTDSTAWPDLVFRLYPNTPHYAARMEVSSVASEGQGALPHALSADGTVLRVTLPRPLAPGARETVTLEFSVQVPTRTEGYTLFGWEDDVLSLPGFYPTLAVRSDAGWATATPPVFADPLFNPVAEYRLTFTAPSDLTIVASGVTLGIEDAGEGRRTWHIVGAPLRDLTLLAGRGWQSVSDTAAGARVISYFPEGDSPAGEAALLHAAAALRLFSDRYGPYPYREFKVVAAPLGRRGMEYTGLAVIGAALYDPHRDELPFLVAHETAHQWWYAQVGNDPLAHPWLDEGLAEYAAFDYYQGIYGRAAAEALLTGRWQTPVRFGDEHGIAGAVTRAADQMDDRSYPLLAYAKAALFFNALREQVGDERYHATLQAYVRAYRWQIVTPQHLLGLVQSVAETDVRPLVTKWLQ